MNAHRDGRIQTGLGLFVPCGRRAGALRCKLLAQLVEPVMALIQSLNAIHKKAQLVLSFFMYGAQGRNRTIDTRIFSPLLHQSEAEVRYLAIA